MKYSAALCSAAIFALTSCDEEKAADAKAKTVEAAKSVGDLVKDSTGKVVEKGKEVTDAAIEKVKPALEAAAEKVKPAVDAVKAAASPALESFKARLGGFSETMKRMEGQAGQDPTKAKEMLTQLTSKLNTIPTDGIPADLQAAFQSYRSVMRRVLEQSQSIPATPEAQQKWIMDNAEAMKRLEDDAKKAEKDLKEAAARHGLTGLALGGATD